MASKPSINSSTAWTDEELRRSVEIYVLLLRFQEQGSDERFEPLAQALLGGVLAERNGAAIRYRLRNISAVAQELGGPILRAFSPAESVGRLVRPRIREMLIGDPAFARLISSIAKADIGDTAAALNALRILREAIGSLERELGWRGHNGPPDLSETNKERADLQEALSDIDAIEVELVKPDPDPDLVRARSGKLLGLLSIFGKWIGARTTKFVDTTLLAAAPLVAAKVTRVLPALIDAVEAAVKAVGH